VGLSAPQARAPELGAIPARGRHATSEGPAGATRGTGSRGPLIQKGD
jgi:hypothetical protein